MRNRLQILAAGIAAFIFSGLASAQLVVAPINGTTITADSLAQSLLSAGSGITITNATYTGANGATGTFSGGAGIVGIASGIVLTSGSVNNVVGPNNDDGASGENGLPGDSDLTTLAGVSTNDASILTITFIPTGNTVQFSYVFGSEEYNEFIGQFNDVFGFFVNGANRAVIPGTNQPVTVNSINCGNASSGTPPPGPGSHCNLYINNDPPTRNTQLDGLTTVLSFTATVNPNVPNTLKIAIADASDDALDSAVFIAAGSLSVCGGPSQPACGGGTGTPTVSAEPVPTLGEWAIIALATGLALLGFVQLRRRG